jgi:hypothetical protein
VAPTNSSSLASTIVMMVLKYSDISAARAAIGSGPAAGDLNDLSVLEQSQRSH